MKVRLLAASPLLLILWLGGMPSISARQADPPSRWYGNVGLTAGYFDRIIKDEDEDIPIDTLFHMRGEASLLLGYRAPRFYVSTQVKGQWVGKETDFEHASLNQKDEVKLKSRRTVLRQPSGSWRTDFQWKPSDRNQYNTFILYQLERDKTVGSTFDTHFLLEDEEDELQNYRLALEERRYLKQTFKAGWRSTHLWPERHLVLNTIFDGTSRFHRRHSLWEQATEKGSLTYLLTPQSHFHEGKASAILRHERFLDVPSLQLEAGLQARSSYTEDRNGGQTLIAPDVWRDSARLRERFNHLALWLEPGINVDYRTGTWHFRAEGALQSYGEQLTDERHFRDIAWDRPIPVGRLLTEWAPSKTHRLSLNATHAIKQPTDLQRCWYERQDANADQLFRGNPDLPSSRIEEITLNYAFRWNRFQASSQSRLTYRNNEAERTFTKERIDGRDYKVFTWVSTSFKEIYAQTLTAGWTGQVFSADARIRYEQTLQRSASREKELRTHHWELSADTAVKPGKGWALSGRVSYTGDVKTLYSLLQGYCTLNARIAKSFQQVTVFLEGRDLLDQPVKREFTSADESEVWAEIEYLNRRIILAGVTWSF